MPLRVHLLFVLCLAALLPGDAMAAFVTVNGFDNDELSARDVRIAVVKVTHAQEHPVHKQKGWQELSLKVQKVILGQKPSPVALSKIIFPNSIAVANSAWPEMAGKVFGHSFLMCWIGNSPCGLGLSVYFGPNHHLPLLVSGPNDKQVGALVKLLKVIGLSDENAKSKAMRSAFLGPDVLLSQMADAGLRRIDPKHVHSPVRYEKLVSLLKQIQAGDPSFAILRELRDMKSGRADFKEWKGVYASRTTKDFDKFRSQMLTSLWNEVIAKQGLNKEVRRSTMALLVEAPFFLGHGRGRDATDEKIIKSLERLLQDPIVEVRRTTIDSLLRIAKKLQRRRSAKARSIRQLVKRAYDKESAPEEKIILKRRFRAILGQRP